MRWAALDFETATSARDSACSLGVVVVDDGEVAGRQSWLIRPPRNEYQARNIEVHGITPAQTEHAPEFDSVWREAEQLIAGRPLVAHNAPFDRSVLQACCARYGIEHDERHVWCTVRLSRRVWPDLGSWRLPSVAEHIGARLSHHDALSDASACSSIVAACLQRTGTRSLDELGAALGVG